MSCSFLRNTILFPLHSDQQCIGDSLSPHPCQHVLFFLFWKMYLRGRDRQTGRKHRLPSACSLLQASTMVRTRAWATARNSIQDSQTGGKDPTSQVITCWLPASALPRSCNISQSWESNSGTLIEDVDVLTSILTSQCSPQFFFFFHKSQSEVRYLIVVLIYISLMLSYADQCFHNHLGHL